MAEERDIATAQGNGQSAAVQLSNLEVRDVRGAQLRTLFVDGTFDGATVTFQISLDGVTYFDVIGADGITAKTALNVEFRANFCRINVAGGGGTVAVDAWLA